MDQQRKSHRFSRDELYALVWAKPMKTLAKEFGISDVGLAKTCKGAAIPLPPRGYWAKLQAGKPVDKMALPARGIGASDTVSVAPGRSNYWYRDPINLNDPEPVEPTFPNDLDAITARVRSRVGKAAVARDLEHPHPIIARLLREDSERAKKALGRSYVFEWEKPQFESVFEQRRLRVLSALFEVLQRSGGRPLARGKSGRDLGVTVGSQYVAFTLDRVGAKRQDHGYETVRADTGSSVLQLGFGQAGGAFELSWKDESRKNLEKQLTDIAVSLIVQGEKQYRANTLYNYQWRVEQRVRMREELRQQELAAERAREERRILMEKRKVRGLLRQAVDYRKANDIRFFVQEIERSATGGDPALGRLAEWIVWAGAQADRIDPTKNGQLLEHMKASEIELADDEQDES